MHNLPKLWIGFVAFLLAIAPAIAAADPLADGVAAFKAKDYQQAQRLLGPLAAQGDAAAEFHLGLMQRFGLGLAENDDSARKLNLRAAEQGYPQARQLVMAECLADDSDADCPRALAWLRADAEAGNVEDQAALGAMYLTGRGGVTRDAAEAVAWFRRAGDGGDVRADDQLGAIYAAGLDDVPADPAQSIAWYRRAAQLGDAEAKRALVAASS
ncbi:MAG TPA: tetratricopeptide repeat protein [Caulobacteraceae bacterium]|nr:tetratricopeptide repeat protein [Caulobacteraceae bacterium]